MKDQPKKYEFTENSGARMQIRDGVLEMIDGSSLEEYIKAYWEVILEERKKYLNKPHARPAKVRICSAGRYDMLCDKASLLDGWAS